MRVVNWFWLVNLDQIAAGVGEDRCAGNPKAGPQRNQITRNLGLSKFADWVFSLPHSRFIKRHETKTHTYQHSGSSVRVPLDGDVRSASTELGLY
jgi:hypothetical protein